MTNLITKAKDFYTGHKKLVVVLGSSQTSESLHLDKVEGVHIGVAYSDRTFQPGLAFQQLRAPGQGQHGTAGALKLLVEQVHDLAAFRVAVHQFGVAAGNVDIGLG